jgi:hypothetical protein
MGVVHPESSNTVAGMFLLPRNEICIGISGLLPDLGSGGACLNFLWLIESLEGKAFCLREVLIMNCLLTQLRPKWVVSH